MLNNIVVRIREALLDKLLDQVSEEAKKSPRLRMNYNFHQSLDDKCHRMLNAVEPGTEVAIHRRVAKDECFVVLRGKVRGGGIDYRFEIWEKGDLVTARSPSYLSPLKQNEG